MEILERITVPHTIYQWKQEVQQRDRAQAVQGQNRKAFQDAFHRGLAVIGYERDADGNGTFLLGQWEEPS